MKPPRYYIYSLADPDTNEVRYVGATMNPSARLKLHVIDRHAPVDRRAWMASILARHTSPVMTILEIVRDGRYGAREAWWIEFLRLRGARLLNRVVNAGLFYVKREPRDRPTRADRPLACRGPLLSTGGVAKMLGCSRKDVMKLLGREITAFVFGRGSHLRIYQSDVVQYQRRLSRRVRRSA